jgi:hypothetical protein
MNAPKKFYVFRRPDGHAITSAIADYYETVEQCEAETWDPYAGGRPEGEWSLETREQRWDASTRQCLRGRCGHNRVVGRPTVTADTSPMPEAEWMKAMDTVATAFTALQAHVAMRFTALKTVFASAVDLMHTVRIDAPHTQVCASELGGGTCFCACVVCFDAGNDEISPSCVCDFCGCKVDA